MLLSQMAAEAAKDYKYDIILANVNGRLTILTILRLVKDITFQRLTYLMMMLQLTILAESMPVWTDTKQEKLW